MLRFFVGRAVGYASERHNSVVIMNRVREKIRESVRAYYYLGGEIDKIEQGIIQAWINLTNTICSVVDNHLYTSGVRNNNILVLKSFYDEILEIIITLPDEEIERGNFNE